MADSPPTPAPEAAGAPAAPAPGVDALAAQLQAGNAETSAAVRAVQAATAAADGIAAEAQSAGAGVPVPPMAEIPELPAALEPPSFGALGTPPEVARLLAIEVPVIVQLGTRRMSVGEVMRFSVGAIIEFHKSADEDLELLANNRPIGKGQAVKVGENFGIKLTAIGPVKETIRKLGAVI